jgi:Protein kinase domain/Ankyrin repeats (3 copies)
LLPNVGNERFASATAKNIGFADSMSVPIKKPGPFRFFEDPEDGDSKKTTLEQLMETNASLIPVNFGERIDLSDLKKASKYMNPTLRRKMSFSDFEKRIEVGNLILLDLLVMCQKDTTVLEYLEDQIRNVFEISKVYEDGRGFIYYAITRGWTEVARKLLQLNNSIANQADLTGLTPLHYACRMGNFEIVKMLVENGAAINAVDDSGNTPLHSALMFHKAEVAVFLITRGADKNHVNNRGIRTLDYIGAEHYQMLRGIGLVHGDNEFVVTGALKADLSVKRRCDYYLRLKVIRPPKDINSFQDCYTARDRGRGWASKEASKQPDSEGPGNQASKPLEEDDSPTLPAEKPKEVARASSSKESPSKSLEQRSRSSSVDRIGEEAATSPEKDQAEQDAAVVLAEQPVARLTHRDYVLYDVIGSGSFGEVYLVTNKVDGNLYAMKVYSKRKVIRNGLIKFLFLEKRILMNFDHPFIVKVYNAFQTPGKLYLVMDYCRFKDLGQYLIKYEKIPEYQARILIAEVILAVEELHRRNIIHRDLKPDNILIGEDGHIKLTDFGLSKDNLDKKGLTNTFCGSIAYLPPEIVTRSGHGQSADWYLVGELLYELIIGQPPFFNESKKILLNMILNSSVEYPMYVNRSTKDLIKRLMDRNPKTRLGSKGGAQEIKAHPFFTGLNWAKVYNKECKLFDVKDITPYQCENFNQEIIDKSNIKGGPNQLRIANWSVSRAP